MRLLPFNSVCEACCSIVATYRYCTQHCEPDGNGEFVSTNVIGDSMELHHLHRKCERCGYEWLEGCLGLRMPQEVLKA